MPPPTPTNTPLANEAEQMRKDLESIQKSLRAGKKDLIELQGTLLFQVYKKYNSNRALSYLSNEELRHLPEFIEYIIISSKRVGPYLDKHPNASNFNSDSPLGDNSSAVVPHDDYAFSSAMKKRGFNIGDTTRGLYDWKDRSIHLQMGATLGHAIHEGIHSFSTFNKHMPPFLGTLGSFLYEGATQVFTDMVVDDHKWDTIRHNYEKEVGCAKKLIRDFTEGVVADAYFRMRVGPLAQNIAQKLKINLNQLHKLKSIETDGRSGRDLCVRLGYI